jgi:hypothetical protein
MWGYRPEDDEPNGFENLIRLKTFVFVLFAPPAFGIFLILIGLHNGGFAGFAMAILGAILLGITPFAFRSAWRGDLWD